MKEDLEKIKTEVAACHKCSLWRTRNFPVVGEGSEEAAIMLVGEAPGVNEDRTGRPFCGAAGEILDELLNSIDLARKDIYICNILKCRPPGNRNPQKEEIQNCVPYLEKQIELIKPKVICALGNFAAAYLMEKYGLKDQIEGISKIHGRVFEVRDLFQSIKIIPLYHPAVATYNSNMKEILKRDIKILKGLK